MLATAWCKDAFQLTDHDVSGIEAGVYAHQGYEFKAGMCAPETSPRRESSRPHRPQTLYPKPHPDGNLLDDTVPKPCTLNLTLTGIFSTTPSFSHLSTFCIFIASTTHSSCVQDTHFRVGGPHPQGSHRIQGRGSVSQSLTA